MKVKLNPKKLMKFLGFVTLFLVIYEEGKSSHPGFLCHLVTSSLQFVFATLVILLGKDIVPDIIKTFKELISKVDYREYEEEKVYVRPKMEAYRLNDACFGKVTMTDGNVAYKMNRF